MTGEYRVERFEPGLAGDDADPRTRGWLDADFKGFHAASLTAAEAATMARNMAGDGMILTGVYDDGLPEQVAVAEIPVATFASLTRSLNVGGGNTLDAHLVTAVTVRPSHRRQGVLRRLMTEDLRKAAADGLPVAALTASEATIYGRFGFGPASFHMTVNVDTGHGFAMHAGPSTQVHPVPTARLMDLAPSIFSQFHARTTGSIDRMTWHWLQAAGQWHEERPKEDPALRAAVHIDDAGSPDGYVAYRFHGWETEPATISVVDLVAASEQVYLDLWRYLGSIELVTRITYPFCAPDDVLPWALTDRRRCSTTATEDVLWLRILDVPAALAARPYAVDGSLVIGVRDSLGLAEGTFRLDVQAGRASVRPCRDSADVILDAADLGSLYLGGVTPSVMAAAGRLECRTSGAVALATAMFHTARLPNCITRF